VKTATKVRFQEPGQDGKEGITEEVEDSNEQETKEVKVYGRVLGIKALCLFM
jgi:hypothetical protein